MFRLCGFLLLSLPLAAQTDQSQLELARSIAGDGSGLVLRDGEPVFWWGDQDTLYDLKSSSKSIGSIALGLALADEKLALNDRASSCPTARDFPAEASAVTVFQLATHTAGFDKPGGFSPVLFPPGTRWSYSDAGPNYLADCITSLYRRDLSELLFERVFSKIGITPEDLRWRDNQYRPLTLAGVPRREFGSGVHANVRAMARIGQLFLGEGEQLLPPEFVRLATRPIPAVSDVPVENAARYPSASSHYGLLWWNNGDGVVHGLPRDAFWSWGLHDSLIIVIPSLDLVAARAGSGLAEGWSADPEKIAPLLRALTRSPGAPYPPSEVFAGLDWDPPEEIVRKAEGGDNWPTAWGEDDLLYAAYGDGWGFEPKVERKLSLGFSRVSGGPLDFHGENIRSMTGERYGQGPAGEKASGLTMVGGVLYLWARNSGNAQLAWSQDRAQTWQWADWRLQESFGAPSFLSFGRNNAGARDDYVYTYSQDSDSAYHSADGLVLARAPKDRLREPEEYEFFAGFDASKQPLWSPSVAGRKPVFRNPGRVYRSSVSYHPGAKRYLLCQVIPGEDTRFEGGFGVYDAPEPWGPWTTVFYTPKWDVGPGETCSFPPKWMTDDALHMLFSGDDSFSVRKAVIRLR